MRDWNINIMSYFVNCWTAALPWQPLRLTQASTQAQAYGAPFVSKFFLKDYGSGTNQMGGFVGGAPVLQMADSWTWWIL